MKFKFFNKYIKAISCSLPKTKGLFDEEAKNYNFPLKKSMLLKDIIGLNTHCISSDEQFSSTFAISALKDIFDKNIIKPNELDAIIYVTQTPDFFIPQTSSVLHKTLGLKEDILTFDLTFGCTGFIGGLFNAFFLLEHSIVKNVALITSDVLTKKVNKRDRNSYPIIGDGGAVTIVSKDALLSNEIYCINKTYTKNFETIQIPAGAFCIPSSPETRKEIKEKDGNIRSMEDFYMDGTSVFSFVQEYVPQTIDELLKYAQVTKEEIEYFIFHQPNKFMLTKLADKMNIPYSKMPNNIVENFGNGSSLTIPLNMCFNLADTLKEKTNKLCLSGFGSGLGVNAIVADFPPIQYFNIQEI